MVVTESCPCAPMEEPLLNQSCCEHDNVVVLAPGQHGLTVRDAHGHRLHVTVEEENPHNIPIGAWRDGIFCCAANGVAHSSCCLPWWCMPAALGQVMTRLKLGIWATPLRKAGCLTTCQSIVVAFLLCMMVSTAGVTTFSAVTGDSSPAWLWAVVGNLPGLFGLYLLIVMVRTRSFIRRTYQIPASYCCCDGCCGLEDVCCAVSLPCCTVAQMMRHTADYQTYRGTWCSSTGLPARAPAVV